MLTLRYTAEQIKHKFGECKTRKELFGRIEESFVKEGQVICQFRINGIQITEDEEKSSADLELDVVENVEVLVDTPANLLEAVVFEWTDELKLMVKRVDSICLELRSKGFQMQFTPFVKLVDHCQFFIDTLISIRGFVDLEKMGQKTRWTELEQNMIKAVGESLKAFEKRDANWLADVIEYDLAQSLQEWQEAFEQLKGTDSKVIYRSGSASPASESSGA